MSSTNGDLRVTEPCLGCGKPHKARPWGLFRKQFCGACWLRLPIGLRDALGSGGGATNARKGGTALAVLTAEAVRLLKEEECGDQNSKP